MKDLPNRRTFLGTAAFALAAPAFRDDPPVRFRLIETAGLRRFGYPVSALLPAGTPDQPYQLVSDGQVVPAQFTATKGPAGGPRVALDFAASLGPLETREYQVQVREGEAPPYDTRRGMTIERPGDGRVLVRSGADLIWGLREDLDGHLNSVHGGRLDYVAGGSAGLLVRERGGDWRPFERSGANARGERSGPFAAIVVYAGKRGDVPWRLDAIFPRTKSWVETRWEVNDPGASITGLGVELGLLVEGAPTLVDFGTRATVYATLKGDESMALVAGGCPGHSAAERGWVVTKGNQVFARDPGLGGAEGWVHVMDQMRCTAAAVSEFAQLDHRDRIEVTAGGRLRITREFATRDTAPPAGPKRLDWWLHFVPMPVQVGALTSPQAMQSPLRVEWD